MKYFRITIGLLSWIAIGAGVWWCVDGRDAQRKAANRAAVESLWQYAAAPRNHVELVWNEPVDVAVGDPILVADAHDSLRQVGEISEVVDAKTGEPLRRGRAVRAKALMYASAPKVSASDLVTYHTSPDSIEWVLATMLPLEKRERIGAELSSAFEEHHAEILAELRPIVEASLQEGFLIVEQDLALAIADRRDELEAIGGRYQREVVEKEIVPLVRDEVWPIVRRHAEPTANEIGQEIWQKASLWRFGWRYVYDKSFLPKRELFKQEWQRFLDKEAAPVLSRHTDDMVRVQQRILADVARNDEVQNAVRRNLARIVQDPEVQQIVWEIIREVVIDNPRLHEVLERHWTSPEAQQAFRIAGERLEPTVVEIVEMLFGSEDGGITPEFARVLRSQLLGKDRRWLVLESRGAASESPRGRPIELVVERATQFGDLPMLDAAE